MSKLTETQLNSILGIANHYAKGHPDQRIVALARAYKILHEELEALKGDIKALTLPVFPATGGEDDKA